MAQDVITGYFGTYFSPESAGIYRFLLHPDTGVLDTPTLWYDAPDSKYLSLRDGLLAAPLVRDGKAGACLLDTRDGTVRGTHYAEHAAACFVLQDETCVYTANYHEGSILVYDRRDLSLLRRIETGAHAGCHQLLLHGRFLIAICLLRDEVLLYDRTREYALVGTLSFPKGTGPRHGIFDRTHTRLYLVTELSNQLFIFDTDGEAGFRQRAVYDLLPQGAVWRRPPASAAIRLSPDERFVYVSTRFADVLTVFRVTPEGAQRVQQVDSGGQHPRDFVLTRDGRFVLVAHRESGGLVVLPRDAESGRLGAVCARVPAPEAVSIVLQE